MSRTVAQKMGVKQGTRAVLVHAPKDAVKEMDLPALDLVSTMRGRFGYIHLFVRTAAEMKSQFAKAKRPLVPGGMLWVSWPKGRTAT